MSTHSPKISSILERSAAKTRARFLRALTAARTAKGFSQAELAQLSGTTVQAIADLETGSGAVQTLLPVMNALGIAFSGVGNGALLSAQLSNCRAHQDLTIDDVARETGLTLSAFVDLEQGKGKAADLFRVLAYLAPKACFTKVRLGFAGTEKRADGDRRFTPAHFMESIYAAFGPVSLDPCADAMSSVVADHQIYFANGGDGLREEWCGSTVFVNPPFSNQLGWLQRAHDQWRCGNAGTVVCLVPVKTCNRFFQTLYGAAHLYALEGRLRFTNPQGKSEACKYSLMLVVFGGTARQRARFAGLERGLWLKADLQTAAWLLMFRLGRAASNWISLNTRRQSPASRCDDAPSQRTVPEKGCRLSSALTKQASIQRLDTS